MKKPHIFISYRREDTAPYAGWINHRLVTEFGSEQIFFDIDTIPPGDDFVEVLSQRVESCDVLLAVIGNSWLSVKDPSGRPRIQNPEDFVAVEIGAALRRKVRVIPLLVGGARMPGTGELPDALALLARRQAHELPDKGFIPALEKLFPILQNSGTIPPLQRGLARNSTPPQPQPPQAGAKRINPKDGLTYVWIPPGKFMMGCSPGEKRLTDEEPAHEVEITKGFWIGETPVTQEAFERVTGSNPSWQKGPKLPVFGVSWEQAVAYCQAVDMRIPTEAEWEYAARAGTTASSYGVLDNIAWYSENSSEVLFPASLVGAFRLREVSNMVPHDVMGKEPNAWGLYDTLGNVNEWTDGWCETLFGKCRVVRGGSFDSTADDIRVFSRVGAHPLIRGLAIGFRCAGQLS